MTRTQEIGKILQCSECREKKTISTLAFHEKRGWIRICRECLPKTLGVDFIQETREMVFKPEEFCEKHDRPKKLWKQGINGLYEPYCFACNHEEWVKSLEHLNLEPLKIVKFFYKKGADTWPTIQKLVYIAYIKGLEQKKVLFEEKFEKWEGNPMLISLYEKSTRGIYPLSPATVLQNIEEPSEAFAITLLTDVYQNYARYEDKERIFNLMFAELFQPNEEKESDPKKIYPWKLQKKEKYIRSYAS